MEVSVFDVMMQLSILWVVPALTICLLFACGVYAVLWMFREPIKRKRSRFF